MNTMQYEGFLAEIEIDQDKNVLRGLVVNAPDLLQFEGTTVSELEKAIRTAVDKYRAAI